MTIAAAWVRTLANGAEELLFCSDSRLSGGNRFDHGQKIFRFARSDIAICFAGSTYWAYPMIVAAVKAADLHVPSLTKALGIAQFRTHLLRILNLMQSEVHNYAQGQNIPTVTFLLGGYDWWQKRFRLWRLVFDETKSKFVSHERKDSSKLGNLGIIEIAGDAEWTFEARKRLKTLTQQRHGRDMGKKLGARFDLEPFEVINGLLLKADCQASIGGAPQIVKIYQYLNSVDVGVFWPSLDDGRLYLSGRPVLDYEKTMINSVIDAKSLTSTWTSGTPSEAATYVVRARENDEKRRTGQSPSDNDAV